MYKFFVVGDVTVDQMYFVNELPEPGGEVSATRAVMEPGGAGGTIATALARLGNEVKLAARIGTGPFADLALSNVRKAGADTSLIQVDERRQTSSVTLLVTPDTQRTMISAGGASRHMDAGEFKPGDLASCDALVMSAYSLIGGMQREYAVKALDAAKQAGLTTFIDMGSGAVNALRDRLISLVREVDYLLMNQRELYTLTGENSISDAVVGLAGHGIKRLVVKVGEMGSIVITPELTELVEAFEVDGVLDSTGAGDYYTAAFAHGIMQGYDLHYAARLGNIAG
ncbi:MAG TPA: carbohydrate kinase family protein, partial [Trueperaceae bacterium]